MITKYCDSCVLVKRYVLFKISKWKLKLCWQSSLLHSYNVFTKEIEVSQSEYSLLLFWCVTCLHDYYWRNEFSAIILGFINKIWSFSNFKIQLIDSDMFWWSTQKIWLFFNLKMMCTVCHPVYLFSEFSLLQS